MTQVAIARGLYFPDLLLGVTGGTNGTMDAATEKYAMIGRMYWDGRPGSAKTLSTGTIQFRTGGSTFAAAAGATTLDIGIQDVATGTGPIAQPDGTFDVKKTMVSATDTISSNAWNTVTMNSGTKSIAHGDLIAVVWDMTLRGGADSVVITPSNSAFSGAALPTTNAFVSSAWQTTNTLGAAQGPNVVIVADDGTLGTIGPTIPYTTNTNEQWVTSTNPDERGMMFQVPWDCKIDAFWIDGGGADAAGDRTLTLWSTPTSSLSSMTTLTIIQEQEGVAAGDRFSVYELPAQISLSKNVNYGLTVFASSTSNVRQALRTLGATGHRALIPGGTTLAKITRDGGSGDFTAESPAITIYSMGVRISSFDDGLGSTPVGQQAM